MIDSSCASLEEVGSPESNLGGPIFLSGYGFNAYGYTNDRLVLAHPREAQALMSEEFPQALCVGNA